MPASPLSAQSTVILESLQMQEHRRGHFASDAGTRKRRRRRRRGGGLMFAFGGDGASFGLMTAGKGGSREIGRRVRLISAQDEMYINVAKSAIRVSHSQYGRSYSCKILWKIWVNRWKGRKEGRRGRKSERARGWSGKWAESAVRCRCQFD